MPVSKWCVTVAIFVTLLSAMFARFFPDLPGMYDGRRFLLLLLLISTPFLYLASRLQDQTDRSLFKKNLYFAPLIAILLFTAAIFDTSKFRWIEPVFYSLFFINIALIGSVLSSKGLVKYALNVFLITLVFTLSLYSLVSLLIYGFFISGERIPFEDVLPWGFVHVRYWSHIASWSLPILPLALLLGEYRNSSLWRLAVWLSATVWWWLLYASMARGSMCAIVLSALLVVLLFRSRAYGWIKYAAGFMISGVGAWILLSCVIPHLVFGSEAGRDVYFHSSGRLTLWKEAFAMSMQYFPLGMGAQSWMTHASLTDSFPNEYFLNHPHNMYLLWAAEYGWIFIVALAAFGLRLAVLVNNRCNRTSKTSKAPGHVLVALSSSVLAASIHAGVSAVYIAPASLMIGLWVLAIFWGLVHSPIEGAESSSLCIERKSRMNLLIIVCIFVLLLMGSFWYVAKVKEYYQAMLLHREELVKSNQGVRDSPRFWFYGYFPGPENNETP